MRGLCRYPFPSIPSMLLMARHLCDGHVRQVRELGQGTAAFCAARLDHGQALGALPVSDLSVNSGSCALGSIWAQDTSVQTEPWPPFRACMPETASHTP